MLYFHEKHLVPGRWNSEFRESALYHEVFNIIALPRLCGYCPTPELDRKVAEIGPNSFVSPPQRVTESRGLAKAKPIANALLKSVLLLYSVFSGVLCRGDTRTNMCRRQLADIGVISVITK